MRNGIARVCFALAILTTAACNYRPPPVLMQGTASDIAVLAGTWEGEYFSNQSGRRGMIRFDVRAETDTAYGDVVMESSPGQFVRAEDVRWGGHAQHSPAPEVLQVAFVSVRAGVVQGSLEPYEAPDCRCVVRTTFRGTLSSNTIAGEYVTTSESWLRQSGKWSVRRRTIAAAQ